MEKTGFKLPVFTTRSLLNYSSCVTDHLFFLYIFSVRAQKSLGLVSGSPEYAPVPGFVTPDITARTSRYSDDGRLYAYALPAV